MITQAGIKSLLHYNHDTGVFTWLENRGSVSAGSVAGCIKKQGYESIKINMVDFFSHRLAWVYMYGDKSLCSDREIDHLNHKRSDNRILNLRVVTRSENQKNRTINKNNTSGHCGVTWNKQAKKWQAQVCSRGKSKYIGVFDVMEDAIKARVNENTKHDFHKNHGSKQLQITRNIG